MEFIAFDFATPYYDQAVRLRHAILRAPLGMEFYAEDLEKEYAQYHLGAFLPNGRLISVLSLAPTATEGTLKMRQVATAEQYQGKGIGSRLVEFSEEWASLHGYSKFVLHAREAAVPFYQKMNYKKKGKKFKEVGIPHYKMEKSL